MVHRWMQKVVVVASTLGLGLAMLTGPAFAASNPVAGSSSSTATTSMVMASSGISPLTTSYGSCGSASLTMFNGGSRSAIDANYQLVSTQGNIVYENVTVTLNNGKSKSYDGPGPVFSAAASGQFTFSRLRARTTYRGTLTGTVTLDSGTTCTIIPTSTNATTR